MKLLSLNAHSLIDFNSQNQVCALADFIEKERPHIICLQEVNQPIDATVRDKISRPPLPTRADGVSSVPYKSGNFLLLLADALASKNISYDFCWLPIKIGYGKYDEGLAILSVFPMSNVQAHLISKTNDYADFRRRMCIFAQIEALGITVCNLHTSRFDDRDEPFVYQWENIKKHCPSGTHILLGDFNCPDTEKGGGYDKIISDGYYDLYRLASSRVGYATVKGDIDGWKDGKESPDKRIDFIFSSRPFPYDRISFKTVFCGNGQPQISDHFGIFAQISGKQNKKEI